MSGAPFLLIDAGNSRIKWSLTAPDGKFAESGVFGHAHAEDASDPDWAGLPRPSGAWVSNVAGEVAGARIAALIEARWPGLARTTVQAEAERCGVTNRYEEPSKLGSDRWSGLIGARAAFPGEHLLIATFGTATTLEALRADGVFTGGLIAPGWSLMMQSLGSHTAQLPTLSPASARRALALDPTPSVFATGTRAALSSGCLLAQAGLIERAWRELRDELNDELNDTRRTPDENRTADVRLVLGGGAAPEIASVLTVPHTRHDSLVLSGLSLIARDTTARNLS